MTNDRADLHRLVDDLDERQLAHAAALLRSLNVTASPVESRRRPRAAQRESADGSAHDYRPG